MEAELRAHLEALEQRQEARFETIERNMATKADLEHMATKADLERMATRAELDTLRAEVRSGDEETRRHMDAVAESILVEIRKIAEGHALLLEHMDRRFDEYDRNLMNAHVVPLRTVVSDHEVRIAALEQDRR